MGVEWRNDDANTIADIIFETCYLSWPYHANNTWLMRKEEGGICVMLQMGVDQESEDEIGLKSYTYLNSFFFFFNTKSLSLISLLVIGLTTNFIQMTDILARLLCH